MENNLIVKVFESGDKLVVSSRDIAKDFGKEHRFVTRDIEKLLNSQRADLNGEIIESSYVSDRGRTYREYLLTKDGFTLYMFNIQGYQEFKLAYIKRFNEMENFIKESNLSEEFKYFRETGKVARKELAGIIQENLDPNDTHKMSNYTNLIYKSIFGRNAKQMKVDRGLVKSDNLRDSLTSEELGKVLKTEERVKGYINTFVDMGLEYKEIYKKVKELLLK